MILIFTIVIIALVLIFCIYRLIKLIRRSETADEYIQELEDTIFKYDTWVVYIRRKILDSYNTMQQLDKIGAFESDDETGTVFNNMKTIIDSLNEDFEWLNQPDLEQKKEVDQNTTSPMTQKQR